MIWSLLFWTLGVVTLGALGLLVAPARWRPAARSDLLRAIVGMLVAQASLLLWIRVTWLRAVKARAERAPGGVRRGGEAGSR